MRQFIAAAVVIASLTTPELQASQRSENDARSVATYRAGLASAAEMLRSLDRSVTGELLTGSQKQTVRETWAAFLDYLLALDSIGAHYRDQKGEEALVIGYGAFLAQYRGALEMIDAAQLLPGADEILNEPATGIGLPGGSYARVKFRFLNVARATEFAALGAMYQLRGGSTFPKVRALIDEDSRFILRTGGGKGQVMTAANAARIARDTAFTAWFPVQKGVAEWMGDTRVARGHEFLVTEKQIAELAPLLEPGDVLLERREWYVSNVGLPGFWPHTALYIGTAAERSRYFADPDVRAWVREQGRADGDFEALLRERGDRYSESTAAHVIEAISEGVSFTTLEHSAAADSLAAIRPRASRKEKAIAIARAFALVGLPYDFNFDLQTDNALVCSELVYRAYEGNLALPVSKTMNHLNVPPNEIVREFDRTFGTPAQQFDLVVFLDGHERKRVAIRAGVEEFRSSWRRPKWHIVTK